MGNSFFCGRCDIDKFKLSRACADQFLNDDNDVQLTSEERWIQKLKCLDDVHSKMNGITEEMFNELADKIEKKLQARKTPDYCHNRDLLIECLRKNPNCMLNCTREVEEFIDCVDTQRIRKIKQRIQECKEKKIHVDRIAS